MANNTIRFPSGSLSSRAAAHPYRDAIGELLADDSVATVTVNLDDVEYLSKSFADESIGVLVRFYGYDALIRKLRLVGGNRDVQKSIAEAIYIRQQEALAETV